MPKTKSSPGVSGCDLSEVSRASSAKLRWIWPFSSESWKVNNDRIIWYEAEISVRTVPVGVYIYRWWSPLQGLVNNKVHTAHWKTEAGKLRNLPNFKKPWVSRLHWSLSFLQERIQVSFQGTSLGPWPGGSSPSDRRVCFFLLGLPSDFWTNGAMEGPIQQQMLWKKKKKKKECDF